MSSCDVVNFPWKSDISLPWCPRERLQLENRTSPFNGQERTSCTSPSPPAVAGEGSQPTAHTFRSRSLWSFVVLGQMLGTLAFRSVRTYGARAAARYTTTSGRGAAACRRRGSYAPFRFSNDWRRPCHFGARRQPGRNFALPQLGAGPIWLYNARSLVKAPLTQAAATRQASIPGVS